MPTKLAKDFVAITLINSHSYIPGTKFFCSLCNCNLSPLDETKKEYVCSRCNLSYFPNKEEVKRANKFDTPGGRDRMPIVSMVSDDKRELSSSYKRPKLSPFFKEMLSRPGVNLIDYQTSEY